jgi:hypothetical protein
VLRRGLSLRDLHALEGTHVLQRLAQHVCTEGEGWLQGQRTMVLLHCLVEPAHKAHQEQIRKVKR